MKKPVFTVRYILVLILIIVMVFLSGCSAVGKTPATPTEDPAVQQTIAAGTEAAQLTETALHQPTDTPVPTDTPEPTLTPTETNTPIPPTATPTETPTITPTIEVIAAEFKYASTFPEYKFRYLPNEKFGVALGFTNIGTTTWEPGCTLVMTGFSGEVTIQTSAGLGKNIAPGESVEFSLWAYGSETLGRHIFYYQLYDRSGTVVEGGSAVFTYESY